MIKVGLEAKSSFTYRNISLTQISCFGIMLNVIVGFLEMHNVSNIRPAWSLSWWLNKTFSELNSLSTGSQWQDGVNVAVKE